MIDPGDLPGDGDTAITGALEGDGILNPQFIGVLTAKAALRPLCFLMQKTVTDEDAMGSSLAEPVITFSFSTCKTYTLMIIVTLNNSCLTVFDHKKKLTNNAMA